MTSSFCTRTDRIAMSYRPTTWDRTRGMCITWCGSVGEAWAAPPTAASAWTWSLVCLATCLVTLREVTWSISMGHSIALLAQHGQLHAARAARRQQKVYACMHVCIQQNQVCIVVCHVVTHVARGCCSRTWCTGCRSRPRTLRQHQQEIRRPAIKKKGAADRKGSMAA